MNFNVVRDGRFLYEPEELPCLMEEFMVCHHSEKLLEEDPLMMALHAVTDVLVDLQNDTTIPFYMVDFPARYCWMVRFAKGSSYRTSSFEDALRFFRENCIVDSAYLAERKAITTLKPIGSITLCYPNQESAMEPIQIYVPLDDIPVK